MIKFILSLAFGGSRSAFRIDLRDMIFSKVMKMNKKLPGVSRFYTPFCTPPAGSRPPRFPAPGSYMVSKDRKQKYPTINPPFAKHDYGYDSKGFFGRVQNHPAFLALPVLPFPAALKRWVAKEIADRKLKKLKEPEHDSIKDWEGHLKNTDLNVETHLARIEIMGGRKKNRDIYYEKYILPLEPSSSPAVL